MSHRVGVPVVVVEVGIERDVRKVALQRIVPGLFHKAQHAALELFHIFCPCPVLVVVGFLQQPEVAGFVQQLIVERVGAVLRREGAQLLDHIREQTHAHRRAAEFGIVVGMGEDLKETAAVLRGEQPGALRAPFADAAGRNVDDAAQTQIIRRRVDDVEIGQHVLDLRVIEKARAAEHEY